MERQRLSDGIYDRSCLGRLQGLDACAGAAADLRNAEFKHCGARRLRFTRGDNQSRIRNRNTQHRDNLLEDVIRNGIGEGLRINIVGGTDARNADGVRTDALRRLQVLRMHEESDEIVTVEVETEQHAASDIVDSALHRAVHRLGVVGVVVFRTGRVQLLVRLFVVGLLKQDVRADAGILELAVVFDRGRGDVHVHAADRAVFVLDAVNRVKAFKNVLDRVVLRVLAGFEREPLVPHVLQRDHLGGDLLLRQLLAADVGVAAVVRTVGAAVDAVVRQIKRREHHDPVAVELLLDLLGHGENAVIFLLQIAFQQDRGFAVRKPLAGFRFLENGVNQRLVVLVFPRIREGVEDLLIVDEFGCFR